MFIYRDLPLMFDMEHYLCEEMIQWKRFVELEASRIVLLSNCFTHLQDRCITPFPADYLEWFRPLRESHSSASFLRRYVFLVRLGFDVAFHRASKKRVARVRDGVECTIERTFSRRTPFFPLHGLAPVMDFN